MRLCHFEHAAIGGGECLLAMTARFVINIYLKHARRVQIGGPNVLRLFAHLFRIGQLFEVLTLHPECDVLFAKLFFQKFLQFIEFVN